MHALMILQRCVAPLLAGIHCRRLAGLLEAVAAAVSGPRLTLSEWVRSNPLRAAFVLVRKPKLGRRAKTASGKRKRSKKSLQAARNAREPWLLVASTRLADWPAKRLVKVYLLNRS